MSQHNPDLSPIAADTVAPATANERNEDQFRLPFCEGETESMMAEDEAAANQVAADDSGISAVTQTLPVRRDAMAVPAVDQTLGQRLRAAREARGWSCEEVAAQLKLPARVVKRIEADDFHDIAHAVYLRGYLTSYTRLVGLPTVLAERVAADRCEQPPLIATGTVSRSRYLFDRYSVSATYLVLTAIIVLPAVWLASHGGLEQNLARTAPLDVPAAVETPASGAAPLATVTSPQVAAAAPAAAAADARTLASAETPTPTAQATTTPVVASMTPFPALTAAPAISPGTASGDHTLTLKFTAASWVEVTAANGDKLEYGLLPAGSERNYHSPGALSVRIGNAEGATVEVDGRPVDLAPYQRANVARLKLFGTDGVVAHADN